MGKVQKMLSIDEQVYNNFLEVVGKGNVSNMVQRFMEDTTTAKLNNNSADKRILIMEIENLTKTNSKVISELTAAKEQLNLIEQQEQKQQKEKLESEAEQAKKIITCINCSKQIEQHDMGKFKFINGSVCKGCYMSADSDDVKRWNTKQDE